MKDFAIDTTFKETLYEQLFNHLKISLFIISLKGKIILMNESAEKSFDFSIQEFNKLGILRYAKLYMHPQDIPQFKNTLLALTTAKRKDYLNVFRLKNKSGKYRSILAMGDMFKDDDDNNPGLMVNMFIDITNKVQIPQHVQTLLSEKIGHTYLKELNILSVCEEDILNLIAEGLTTKEIAEARNIHFETAKSHRKSIMKKLEAKNAAQLASILTVYRLLHIADE